MFKILREFGKDCEQKFLRDPDLVFMKGVGDFTFHKQSTSKQLYNLIYEKDLRFHSSALL